MMKKIELGGISLRNLGLCHVDAILYRVLSMPTENIKNSDTGEITELTGNMVIVTKYVVEEVGRSEKKTTLK